MTDKTVEELIQEKNLNAPRITPAHIKALMEDVTYYVQHIPDTCTVIAVAFDKNGFSLGTGMAGCASPENFNLEIGEKIACENAARIAEEKLWELEGYRLKCSLAG